MAFLAKAMGSELSAIGIFLMVLMGIFIVRQRRARDRDLPKFERIERQGGTWLLSKKVMGLFYSVIEPVGRALVRLNVSPNSITWISLLSGAAAGIFAGTGRFGFAAIALGLAGVLDIFDGMVARMTGRTSETGYVLDSHLDRYVEFFFLAGIAIHLRGNTVAQGVALLALLGSFMVSYATLMARFKSVEIAPGSVWMRRPERLVYMIVGTTGASLLSEPYSGYSLITVTGFIAVVANFSAARELFRTMRAIETRERPGSNTPSPTAHPARSDDSGKPPRSPSANRTRHKTLEAT